MTIAAGTTVTAQGNLLLTSGSLNQSAATGTLAAEADITAASGLHRWQRHAPDQRRRTAAPDPDVGVSSSLPVVNIAKGGGALTLGATLRTGRNWTYTSGGLLVAGSQHPVRRHADHHRQPHPERGRDRRRT